MTKEREPIGSVVPAVFTNHEQAEAAITDLRTLGFDDDSLGLLIPDPTHYHLIDDGWKETVQGVTRGVLIGAPIGSLAGIGLLTLAVPGLGAIGLGGALVVGASSGALWGLILGAEMGLAGQIRHITDIERQYDIALQPTDILVVVVAHERAATVCEILQRHGAHCLQETAPGVELTPRHG